MMRRGRRRAYRQRRLARMWGPRPRRISWGKAMLRAAREYARLGVSYRQAMQAFRQLGHAFKAAELER